ICSKGTPNFVEIGPAVIVIPITALTHIITSSKPIVNPPSNGAIYRWAKFQGDRPSRYLDSILAPNVHNNLSRATKFTSPKQRQLPSDEIRASLTAPSLR